MARYQHLPIYKQAMDFAVYIEKIVINFSRYYKYTLGTELRQHSRAVLSLIARANSEIDRLPQLLLLRAQLDDVLILIRLAKEVKAFKSFNSYQFSTEQVVNLCRQNEGWIKSVASDDMAISTRQPRQRKPRPQRTHNKQSKQKEAEKQLPQGSEPEFVNPF